MARSHSTPADYAVNTMNGITFFDGLAQAMPHILAAPTYTPCFHFLLDVMNRTEATLLADVFYLSTLKGAVTEMVDGERHILCTTEFLAASKMRWSRQEQLYNFGTLEDKGFIRRVMHGMPSRRWIIIEWKAIADAIQKSGKPDGKASGKPDNQPSGKPDGKASSKPDRRRTVNRTETIVTASEDSKGNTVPNRPATSASPPQPPGIGTECDSTEPRKDKQGGRLPQQTTSTPVVNTITYHVPHQPDRTPVLNGKTESRSVFIEPDHPHYAELMASVKQPPKQPVASPEPELTVRPKPTPPKPERDTEPTGGGLFGDVKKDNSQERQWAVRLRDALSANHLLTNLSPRMAAWKHEFALLLKAIPDPARIERALAGFIDGMPSRWDGNPRFPIIQCAATFRDKFINLERALKPKPLTAEQQRDLNIW